MAAQWDLSKGEIYCLLEIAQGASDKEIKTAYKRRALIFHPDKNSDPASLQSFLLLNKAIGILSDPEQRKIYDERLARWKDRDKREAEMVEARKILKQDLLRREEAFQSKRKVFKPEESEFSQPHHQYTAPNSQEQHDFSGFQASEPAKTEMEPVAQEIEVLFPEGTRDDALDFLQKFGDIQRFFQISTGHYKFSFGKIESLRRFIRWIEENPQNFCKVVGGLSILAQKQVHAGRELTLEEFLALEKRVIDKLRKIIRHNAES